jgi:hypothetical protein
MHVDAVTGSPDRRSGPISVDTLTGCRVETCPRSGRPAILEHGPVGPAKDRHAVVELEPEAAAFVVHQPVMRPAEQQEVGKGRVSTVGPVHHVVAV